MKINDLIKWLQIKQKEVGDREICLPLKDMYGEDVGVCADIEQLLLKDVPETEYLLLTVEDVVYDTAL